MIENCNFIHYDDGTVSVNPKICSKLSGFGTAELFKHSQGDKAKSFKCSKRGSILGKIQYQSPNIVDGKAYDARKADNWALGMMLYHCVIGKAYDARKADNWAL